MGIGTVIAIGGSEDRRDGSGILREIAGHVASGHLVVCTAASRDPAPLWRDYRSAFRDLRVERTAWLDIDDRRDADRVSNLEMIAGADALLFTGGSQARLTSTLTGSELLQSIRSLYERGGTVAGTSAGASALGEMMVVSGASARSARLHEPPPLVPGLSFLPGLIIDQHFAERGRIGRLIGAVAQHRWLLGVGIDENTAIVSADGGATFRVIGDGAVYVLDASGDSYSNLGTKREGALALHGVRTTLLGQGDRFDMSDRMAAPARPFHHDAVGQ